MEHGLAQINTDNEMKGVIPTGSTDFYQPLSKNLYNLMQIITRALLINTISDPKK